MHYSRRDSFLTNLKGELEKVATVEKQKVVIKDVKLLEVRSLEEEIEKTQNLQVLEDENREVLLYKLDRMRTTIVHVKFKQLRYKGSLHKKNFKLITEEDGNLKMKEARAKSTQALEKLKYTIEVQKNDEKREVEKLEKNVEKGK
jgi:hypothetical protein